jgi:glucose-6-phosphate 1-dehydrogenase
MTGNGAPSAFKQTDPCSLVVFGASGDLMHRLLVPALYNLAAGGLLPDAFALIGVGRSEMSDDALREGLRKSLQQFATRPVEEKLAQRVVGCATYVRGDVDDPVSYDRLRQTLQRIEAERGTKGNRLFYMATPPSAFRPIACQLGRSRLACEENGSWRRIIIEKPFGTDLASARKLNNDLLDVFDENQLYRIDHYLGKETVQNILVLRFANGLFEPIWNRDHIDHVQITVAETLAVGRRGRFYDETGALRDMVPNHLFQLLSLVTMEPPSRFEAGAVRSEKAEVLDAVQVPSEAECAGNTPAAMPAIIRSRTTAPRRTCGRTARRRPMRPSDSRLTTGGGPECRFSCAPERRWRHA